MGPVLSLGWSLELGVDDFNLRLNLSPLLFKLAPLLKPQILVGPFYNGVDLLPGLQFCTSQSLLILVRIIYEFSHNLFYAPKEIPQRNGRVSHLSRLA